MRRVERLHLLLLPDAVFSPANAGAANGKPPDTVMGKGVIRSRSSPGLPGKRLILTLIE